MPCPPFHKTDILNHTSRQKQRKMAQSSRALRRALFVVVGLESEAHPVFSFKDGYYVCHNL
jgi:hypothetical protein